MHLPLEIVRLIDSYDSTKYENFARVLHQFHFRRVFWFHVYSEKPWMQRFFHSLGDAPENHWLFRGEEFYWQMYRPEEYEAYVETRRTSRQAPFGTSTPRS